MRRRFVAWLLLVAAIAALHVLLVRPHLRIESDITAMLPHTAPDAIVEQTLDRFGAAAGRRSVFLVEAGGFASARRAAAAFAQTLAADPAFEAVDFERRIDWTAAEALYGPARFGLLADHDRARLLQGNGESLVQDSLRGLYTPGLRMRSFADDPLHLFGGFLAELGRTGSRLSLREGVLTVDDGEAPAVMVAATLRDSPFAIATQQPVAAALDAAQQAARAASADARIYASGVLGHALANSERARREIGLFGSLSLAGVVAVFLLCFRSLRPLLLVLMALGVGTLTAVTVVHLLFDQIHLLALVFGSSLIGVAVDYAIHFFADRFRGPVWDGRIALAHVGPAIAVGMGTTALGYLAFLVPPFPGLRQMAVLSFVGIVAVGMTVLLVFPLVAGRGGRTLPAGAGAPLAALARAERPSSRIGAALGIALAAFAAAGMAQLSFVDDVRALQSSPAATAAQEAHVRARLGGGIDTRFFLVEGADAEAVLQREEALRARLDPLVASGALGGYQALSRNVPSASRQRQNRQLLGAAVFADGGALPRLLDALEADPQLLAQQRQRFAAAEGRVLQLGEWLASPLSAPYRGLWIGDVDGITVSAIALQGVTDVAPLRNAAQGLAGVRLIDRVADISAVLKHYRRMALAGLAAALTAIAALLALRYGVRPALRQLVAPVGACALTLAVHGWLGVPANLFTVLGLLLVLGLGVDYGVFLREGREARAVSLAAITIAAMTTLLAFGMLSLSATPFIRSLGLAVLVGVASTWLLAVIISAPRRGGGA